MIAVSDEYKESMKSDLRERGYIKVNFGLINEDAQNDAKMDNTGSNTQLWYSNSTKVFDLDYDGYYAAQYATLEKDFCRVSNRGMYFLPMGSARKQNKGLVTENLGYKNKIVYAQINFGDKYSFNGLEIDFGYNYPVEFYIRDNTNSKLITHVTGNTNGKWSTTETFTDTKSINIEVSQMKNEGNRLRIMSIVCGRGLIFENEDVISSTLNESISLTSEMLPESNFSVTLKNYDKTFDYDNPNSIINFFATDQVLTLYYGYELPSSGNVEWIYKGKYYCSEWECDDTSATIYATNLFQTDLLDGINYDADFNKKRFRELMESVLKSSNHSDLKWRGGNDLDYFTVIKTYPSVVSTKEQLQQLANALGYGLFPSSDKDYDFELWTMFYGLSSLRSDTYAEIEADCSNVSNVVKNGTKYDYAFFAYNYIRVSNTSGMYFPPEKGTSTTLKSGFISKEVSNANGVFPSEPFIILYFNETRNVNQVTITFGNSIPKRIEVRVYTGELKYKTICNNKEKKITVKGFNVLNKPISSIIIKFDYSNLPYQRVVVNKIEVSDVVDFKMERNDMLSSPLLTKRNLIKDITVPYYNHSTIGKLENIYEETVEKITSGDSKTIHTDKFIAYPYVGLKKGDTVLGSDDYSFTYTLHSVTINFEHSYDDKVTITVSIQEWASSDKSVSAKLNDVGESITWKNPVVTSESLASLVCNVLKTYYNRLIIYEYDYRGNPELECGDVIIQENDFIENMEVQIIEHEIKFNGAFSGHMKVLRK